VPDADNGDAATTVDYRASAGRRANIITIGHNQKS
jgi:hypothetical protein